MAVVKHAQRVIDTIIQSQRIVASKVPETHPLYKLQEEAPKMYDALEVPSEGNLSHLKTGMAQHYRVNNPYKYTMSDEYMNNTSKPVPWGCYKGAEVGGNKSQDAGGMYDLVFGDITTPKTRMRMPTAKIYYVQHSHMHRMSSMRRANGTGGPYQILFEEDGGFKHQLDGFNRTFTPPVWIRKGFKTPENAVSFCQSMGYAYEVEIPRHRYVTRKSYVDNFKYRPLKTDD